MKKLHLLVKNQLQMLPHMTTVRNNFQIFISINALFFILLHICLYITDKIQQCILKECTLIKLYTKSIDTRLKRLEDGKIKEKNNSYEEVQIIQNQLPLKTIDQVSHFDQSMEDENIKKAFVCSLNYMYIVTAKFHCCFKLMIFSDYVY